MSNLLPKPTSTPCCRRTHVDGREQLIFETPAGQRITLQESPASILVEDGNGNSIVLDPGGITISSSNAVKISAGTVEVTAQELRVNAAVTKFNGLLQADTITANQVLTPGSGNVW